MLDIFKHTRVIETDCPCCGQRTHINNMGSRPWIVRHDDQGEQCSASYAQVSRETVYALAQAQGEAA